MEYENIRNYKCFKLIILLKDYIKLITNDAIKRLNLIKFIDKK